MEKQNNFLRTTKIAHRGLATYTFPENSLSAFKETNEKGYAIETDVHFSKDKKLIICHDDNLLRTTGVNLEINNSTLEEIKKAKMLNTDEEIPTLEELLNLNLSVPILLEIKYQKKAKTNEFLEAIAKAFDNYQGEYAIQSFNPIYVSGYKKLRPKIMCGLLAKPYTSKEDFGNSYIGGIKAFLLNSVVKFKLNSIDFLSYRIKDMPNPIVSNFKGIKLGWTIKSVEEMNNALKYVDNIIFENIVPINKS